MIGTQDRAPKPTVKSEILLFTLAANEELKRTPKPPDPVVDQPPVRVDPPTPEDIPTTSELPFSTEGQTVPQDPGNGSEASVDFSNHSKSPSSEPTNDSGQDVDPSVSVANQSENTSEQSGDSVGKDEVVEAQNEAEPVGSKRELGAAENGETSPEPVSTVEPEVPPKKKPINQTVISMDIPKMPRDYLREPIPTGEACPEHMRNCIAAVEAMPTFRASISTRRRAMVDRFEALTGGLMVSLPARVLRRVLEGQDVDPRALLRTVQHSLLVTSQADLDLVDAWLAKLALWLRRVLKRDSQGRALLVRAVEKIQKQKENAKAEADSKRKA